MCGFNHLCYLVSGSCHPSSTGMGSISSSGSSVRSDIGCLLPQDLCHPYTRISCRQNIIEDQRVCSWVGDCFSFESVWSTFHGQEY